MIKKHLIINPQKKGGVFKSGTTLLLANYFITNNISFKIFDIDNRNATITRFEKLNTEFIDTKLNNEVLDNIFNSFENNDIVLVDVGSGTTTNILEWINDIDLVELLNENDIQLDIVIPITNVKDSVAGLKDVFNTLGKSPHYIILLNHYMGDDFTIFDNSKIKNDIIQINHKIINFPKINNNLITILDKNNMILSEAIEKKITKTLDIQRLKTLQKNMNDIFDKFDIN
jgi:cellulose biosynthesis protein BcsQ